MNNLQKELDRTYNLLAVIPVQGDCVEMMASARDHLRKAFDLAGNKQALGEAQKAVEKEEKQDG